ncbi:hypothetical protein [Lysinibacillus sp. NPDC047702]|uniref:hypothetical protein n=1 Tax=unclassified Lysinibacillus TaxID=2636778 RepID=UPI003D085006
MKKCRYCKHPNPDENKYCEKCELSFKDIAVRKRYYNEKDDPLTNIKENELKRHKKTTNGSKILSFFGGILVILIVLSLPIGSYLYLNKDVDTYNEAVELWNEGEVEEAFKVAKKIPEGSRQYKKAQKLIKDAEDYLLYNKAVILWNDGNYEEAVKIFESFNKESEYYKHAQSVLNDM